VQVENGSGRRYEAATATPAKGDTKTRAKRSGGPKTKEQKRREAEARRAQQQTRPRTAHPDRLSPGQLKQLVSHVESMIEQQEQAKADLEAQLADPALYDDAERMRSTTAAYEAAQRELKDLYGQWETLAEQLAAA